MTNTKRCPTCQGQRGTYERTADGGSIKVDCSECYATGRVNDYTYVDSGAGRREPGEDFAYAVETEDEWL